MKLSKEFKKRVYEYIERNLDKGYSLSSIKNVFIIHGYHPELAERLIRNYRIKDTITKASPVFLALLLIVAMFFFYKPDITTFAITEKSYNYTDMVELGFEESSVYVWKIENEGLLKSIKLNGEAKLNGTVRVYLKHLNTTYLIFDNKKLLEEGIEEITGFAVKREEINVDTKENLSKEEQIVLNSLIADINKTKNNIEIKIQTKGKKENVSKDVTGNITYAQELLLDILINLLNNRDDKIKITIKAEFDPEISESEPTNETSITNETVIINETLNISQPINESNITIPINETIINETIDNASINIFLRYKEDSPYDKDNNGIENIDSAIDFTVEGTEYNWNATYDNLCTRWNVYSVDNDESLSFCHGSDKCCNFIGLLPRRTNWSEPVYLYYGKDGATYKNIVSAQVLYVDYSLDPAEPYARIYYSDWKNLIAEFYESLSRFKSICVETCSLPNFNGTIYEILIEIENSSLILESIDYEILRHEAPNNPPVLLRNFSDIVIEGGQYKINLSEYFYDEDEDTLTFGYYNESYINIEIINETAVLMPGNFTGASYMFFIANDPVYSVTSNVFKVEVRENEKVPKFLKSLRQIIGIG